MVRFREFLQDIDVNQGRYHLNSLLLTGPDTDWQGNGWLGFDGSLDLNLHVKLPAGFTPKLGDLSFLAENMRGDDGRIQIPGFYDDARPPSAAAESSTKTIARGGGPTSGRIKSRRLPSHEQGG